MKNPPRKRRIFCVRVEKTVIAKPQGRGNDMENFGWFFCFGWAVDEADREGHDPPLQGETVQPSATSSIIISVKPRAKKMVPMLECSPSLISGISSSTTT